MASMDARIKANREMDRSLLPDCEAYAQYPDLCPNKATHRVTYGEYEFAMVSLLCEFHTQQSVKSARLTTYDVVFRVPL